MKTIGGYENRDGMEQYNRDTMVKVINDKHFFTKNLINVNSSASKAGKKVIYKKDHTALLKQIISMSGDYTRGGSVAGSVLLCSPAEALLPPLPPSPTPLVWLPLPPVWPPPGQQGGRRAAG